MQKILFIGLFITILCATLLCVGSFSQKKHTQIEGFLHVWFNVQEEHNKQVCYEQYIEKILRDYYTFSSGSRFVQRDRAGIFEKDVDKYVAMLMRMNEREKQFCDHYAFYHGYCDSVELLFDFQTMLIALLQEKTQVKKEYVRLRLKDHVKHELLQDFMDYWDDVFKNGSYNQRQICEDRELQDIPHTWSGYVRPLPYQTLAVNFVPFANIDYIGKGSLYYFIKNQSVLDIKKICKNMFEDLGLDRQYLQELYDLQDLYFAQKRGGHMLQILVPKDVVDNLVYLSLPYGTPFRQRIYGLSYNIEKMRHTNISEFLQKYTNDPWSLTGLGKDQNSSYLLNRIEGRIVFLPDFYAKKNNIKLFRYDFMPKKERKKYMSALRVIVEKIIDTVLSKNEFYKKEDFLAKLEKKGGLLT